MNNKEHLTEKVINKILSISVSINKGLTGCLKKIFLEIVGIQRPIINN